MGVNKPKIIIFCRDRVRTELSYGDTKVLLPGVCSRSAIAESCVKKTIRATVVCLAGNATSLVCTRCDDEGVGLRR